MGQSSGGDPEKMDFWVQHAIDVIRNEDSVEVSVDTKAKDLTKFGRNTDLTTTEELVWIQGGIETLPTTNAIDKFSSSDAGDDQDVVVEGHSISGGNLTFVTQTVTLNGQTETSLDTALARATRLYNAGSTDFAGSVYVYEDDTVTNGVPQTASKIHLRSDGSNNQSLKCATSLSQNDYWLLTSFVCSVNRQNSRSVDFKLQTRDSGGVFRTKRTLAVHSNSGSREIQFRPFLIVKPNSDVRVLATSSGASTQVDAQLQGMLAIKTQT